jgi:hypothetical protein
MTWKDILKEKEGEERKNKTLFDYLMDPKLKRERIERARRYKKYGLINTYEDSPYIILRDFIKFLEEREFVKITKEEGIQVKEPFYIKDDEEFNAKYAYYSRSILKAGDILLKGISYPFARFEIRNDKKGREDWYGWDGRIEDNDLSLKDTKQVIYHFFTNNPSEKQRFLKRFRKGFFGEELK